MPRPPFTVGLVQMAVPPVRADAVARAIAHVRAAHAQGATVICLPELFDAPYFCKALRVERFDLAQPLDGPSVTALQAVARELAVVVVVPIYERQAPGLYRNSAVVVDADGTALGVYRKMHIPHDPLFEEKYYFAPGDVTPPAASERVVEHHGFKVFRTRYADVGVLICWDQWFPEAARLTALLGADVLFFPTAIGWHPAERATVGDAQVDAWRTAQRAHAIANGVFVAAPNRTGFEPEAGTDGIEFFGHSFIADPVGRWLAQGGREETVLVARCDPALIEETRRHWPFLRDRRTDAYAGLTERWLRP